MYDNYVRGHKRFDTTILTDDSFLSSKQGVFKPFAKTIHPNL